MGGTATDHTPTGRRDGAHWSQQGRAGSARAACPRCEPGCRRTAIRAPIPTTRQQNNSRPIDDRLRSKGEAMTATHTNDWRRAARRLLAATRARRRCHCRYGRAGERGDDRDVQRRRADRVRRRRRQHDHDQPRRGGQDPRQRRRGRRHRRHADGGQHRADPGLRPGRQRHDHARRGQRRAARGATCSAAPATTSSPAAPAPTSSSARPATTRCSARAASTCCSAAATTTP